MEDGHENEEAGLMMASMRVRRLGSWWPVKKGVGETGWCVGRGGTEVDMVTGLMDGGWGRMARGMRGIAWWREGGGGGMKDRWGREWCGGCEGHDGEERGRGQRWMAMSVWVALYGILSMWHFINKYSKCLLKYVNNIQVRYPWWTRSIVLHEIWFTKSYDPNSCWVINVCESCHSMNVDGEFWLSIELYQSSIDPIELFQSSIDTTKNHSNPRAPNESL